jgi:hypothetical protein
MKKLLIIIGIFVFSVFHIVAQATSVYDNAPKVTASSHVSCSVIGALSITCDNSSPTLGPYVVSSTAYSVGQAINFTISGLAGANIYYKASTSPTGTSASSPCGSYNIPGANTGTSHVNFNVTYTSTGTSGLQETLATDGTYKVTFTINNVTASSIGTSTVDFTVTAGYSAF